MLYPKIVVIHVTSGCLGLICNTMQLIQKSPLNNRKTAWLNFIAMGTNLTSCFITTPLFKFTFPHVMAVISLYWLTKLIKAYKKHQIEQYVDNLLNLQCSIISAIYTALTPWPVYLILIAATVACRIAIHDQVVKGKIYTHTS